MPEELDFGWWCSVVLKDHQLAWNVGGGFGVKPALSLAVCCEDTRQFFPQLYRTGRHEVRKCFDRQIPEEIFGPFITLSVADLVRECGKHGCEAAVTRAVSQMVATLAHVTVTKEENDFLLRLKIGNWETETVCSAGFLFG